MNGTVLVSLVALVGWLVLVTRSRELHAASAQQRITMAIVWGGLFAIIVLAADMFDG